MEKKKLNSWKAIANYFGRSERTVRRWESAEAMPVHRHQHNSASRIFAFTDELDNWLASREHSANKQSNLADSEDIKIAILPFQFLSAEIDKSYIAAAICEDLTTDLASLKSLKVVSYFTLQQLSQTPGAIENAVMEIGIDYYLEGSVQILDSEIKINVRLVSVLNSEIVWNFNTIKATKRWPDVKKEVIVGILESFQLQQVIKLFSPKTYISIDSKQAWDCVHNARREALKWQKQSIDKAIELLTTAQRLIGKNDFILASLGRVMLQKREAGIDSSQELLNKVKAILNQLEVSSSNKYYVHSLNGWFKFSRGKIDDAISELEIALSMQPNDADTLGLLSNCYLITGQAELAKPCISTLQIIEPFSPLTKCLPGWLALIENRKKDAILPYEEMYAMDRKNSIARMFLVWVYLLNKKRERALDIVENLESNSLVLADKISYSLINIESPFSLTQQQEEIARNSEVFSRFLSFVYAIREDEENSIRWLTQSFSLGFCAFPFIAQNLSYYDSFKESPPLVNLFDRIRKKWLDYRVFEKES